MKVKKKIIIAITLLIPLLQNTAYCESNIAALGNLKGVYINLNIYNKTPPGMNMARINKNRLIRHVQKQLKNSIGREMDLRLTQSTIDQHLLIDIIIKGNREEKKYLITTKASMKQNEVEWHVKTTDYWDRGKNAGALEQANNRVKQAEVKLEYDQAVINYETVTLGGITYNKIVLESDRIYYQNEIKKDKTLIAEANKALATAKKIYSFSGTIEQTLTQITSIFFNDYTLAKTYKEEFDERKMETAALLNQLNEEKTQIASPPTESSYSEFKDNSRKNILYESGTAATLHNPSDTVVAVYKGASLKNIMNMFTNGIAATITDYKVFPDKPTAYKIRILLKGDTEYTGWIPANVIRK
ncbi:MAG: hypothetical protein ACC651_17825 [Candidatus Scalindua sp.]